MNEMFFVYAFIVIISLAHILREPFAGRNVLITH